MVQGNSAIALKYLREVVNQDTDHVNAYLQMGDILRKQGSNQSALKIHQSLTVRPNIDKITKVKVHQSLALDFKELNLIEKAKNEAELVLMIDKKNQWANEFLLNIYELEKDWDKAVKFSKIIQKIKSIKDPFQLSKFLVYQGMDKFNKNQFSDGILLLNKAIKTSPDFDLPYLRLGNIYANHNDFINAIKNWELYIFYSKKIDNEIFSKVESAFFELGQFGRVENFYRKIIEKNPNNLIALINLSNILEQKGDHKASLSLIDDALIKRNDSIQLSLMKLKLSLKQLNEDELIIQIDKVSSLIKNQD